MASLELDIAVTASAMSQQRIEHLQFSRDTASGSSEWHAANSNNTAKGRTVVTEEAATPSSGKADAAVEIAPVELSRPPRCMVRKGNGDSDGLSGPWTGKSQLLTELPLQVQG